MSGASSMHHGCRELLEEEALGIRSWENSFMESDADQGEIHCPTPTKARMSMMMQGVDDDDQEEEGKQPAASATKTTVSIVTVAKTSRLTHSPTCATPPLPVMSAPIHSSGKPAAALGSGRKSSNGSVVSSNGSIGEEYDALVKQKELAEAKVRVVTSHMKVASQSLTNAPLAAA